MRDLISRKAARFLMISLLMFCARTSIAQTAIEYNLCGLDFRPIGMHANLPENAIYANVKAPPAARARDAVKRLTFEEKVTLTGGYKQFHFPGVGRLGIPPVYFSDATQGIHQKSYCVKVDKTTAFPSGETLAATWDRNLAYQYARSISEECQAYGINVLLGPGLNLYRNSEGGRNFEYFGEDPFLTGEMGVSYVKGMQSLGTIATVKHFLGNEQEAFRHDADAIIGERALHELYLAPFRRAITEGGALAVMTGNNLVNGHPGAADTPLAQGELRDKYGFQGMIMSDWANSMFWPNRVSEELTSGHSLLMENNDIFAHYVLAEVAAHPEKKATIEADLDRMVFANFYSFFASGVYDRPYRNPDLLKTIDGHKQVALQTAEEGITLLKNDSHVLPLEPGKIRSLIVLGTDEALNSAGGRGSGAVVGYDAVSFLSGLQQQFGDKVKRLTSDDESQIRSADAVLYFINKKASEGADVPYELPGVTEAIDKYSAWNKNLVVVFSGGNGFPTPWLPKVRALVFAYLLGQERGTALADVLSGHTNPSGKLPFSIESSFDQSPASGYNKLPDGTYEFHGGRGDSKKVQDKFGTVPIRYDEGPYIGYRWYDKKGIETVFPFGFGLSYTTFAYSNLTLSSSHLADNKSISVSVTVKNTGTRDGAEVVQLYVHPENSTPDRPVKELKGFERVFLKSGEKKTVRLQLSPTDIAYWNLDSHSWVSPRGDYTIEVGSSSRDLREKATFRY